MKISLQQCSNRSAVLFPGQSFYFPLDGKNQLKWEYRKQSTMILWWFLHVSLISFFVNFSLPNDLWMAYSEHIPYGKLCWLKKKKQKHFDSYELLCFKSAWWLCICQLWVADEVIMLLVVCRTVHSLWALCQDGSSWLWEAPVALRTGDNLTGQVRG